MQQVLRAGVMLQSSLGHVSSAPEVDCLAFAGQTRAAGVGKFRLSTSTAFLLPQVSTAPLFVVQTADLLLMPSTLLRLIALLFAV